MMEAGEDSLTESFIQNDTKNFVTLCDIWGTHDSEREYCYLLECDAL
jgi:hypothetical protein